MDSLVNKLLNNPFIKIVQKKSRKHNIPIYLVGGFLRDLILGRDKQEFDLDFTLKKDSLKIARSVSKFLKAGYVILDKERGCARVVYNKNGKIFTPTPVPTVNVGTGSEFRPPKERRNSKKKPRDLSRGVFTLDFADFRASTLEKDLQLRDFTINTLAIDVNKISATKKFAEIIIDLYNGLRDLKDGMIKMTSNLSFEDDPLRIVRAFSLAATLGFKLDAKTISNIKKQRNKIPTVSYERIRDEFFKILEVDNVIKYLKLMDQYGVLEKIIPHIKVMRNVKQGGYHHLDVWNHTLETVLQLEKIFEEFNDSIDIKNYLKEEIVLKRSRKSLMKLGALLHDIGKPKAKMQKDGKTMFYGHERIGKEITENIAGLLKLSTKEKDALEKMIFWHLRPGYLAETKMPTERAIFRYFRDTEEEGVSILLLSLADQRATRGPLTDSVQRQRHEKLIKELIQYYFDKQKEKPFVRLINGNDLIKKLKLKPSPVFSKILREVEEAQAEGAIKTKEQALVLARKIVKGRQ